MAEDFQTMTIRVPRDVHEKLRRLAFERHTSINTLVAGYVVKGLEDEESGE
jgi:predicted HicB family RNase H-like nuclease